MLVCQFLDHVLFIGISTDLVETSNFIYLQRKVFVYTIISIPLISMTSAPQM